MKKLLIATTNPGKVVRIKKCFENSGLNILTLESFPHCLDVEETGKTFEENARLKASAYYEMCGRIPTLADDGGLSVDALNGEPGVHSRRWLGYKMTDEEIVKELLRRLQGVAKEKRTARLDVAMAFYDGKEFITGLSYIEGTIAEDYPSVIVPGFPFRTLFIAKCLGKLYHDFTDEEHASFNHRTDLLNRIKPLIISGLR